eukprot:GHVS01024265.1.p1 GENE.GHVS01024265.1~~GHVS01024265.1.p1  ORF type:complete len:121 (-),score=26.14 GHVS01024265.1:19-381(-)
MFVCFVLSVHGCDGLCKNHNKRCCVLLLLCSITENHDTFGGDIKATIWVPYHVHLCVPTFVLSACPSADAKVRQRRRSIRAVTTTNTNTTTNSNTTHVNPTSTPPTPPTQHIFHHIGGCL